MDEHRALIEYDFSNSNLHVLTSLAIALGTISLVGASFVLFSFTKFKSIRNKFSFAQVANMSLADAGACITYLMGAPRDGTDLCSAQAVLMQTFEMCSMLWSTVIATTLFFAIDGQDPWRERRARLAVAAAARRAGTKWRGAFKMEFLCARRGASTFRSGSRRRRGCDVDIPWRRVAAPPRLRRGHSVQTSRGAAAAAT